MAVIFIKKPEWNGSRTLKKVFPMKVHCFSETTKRQTDGEKL